MARATSSMGGRNVEIGGSRRPEDGEQLHGIDEPEKQAEVSLRSKAPKAMTG